MGRFFSKKNRPIFQICPGKAKTFAQTAGEQSFYDAAEGCLRIRRTSTY
jgi:hypothetical protein